MKTTSTTIAPDRIRCTYKRHRMPLAWSRKIDDCKRLCAGWHNRFGGCLVLDNLRLRAICQRLVDDQFDVEDCVWAIEAYYQYCQGSEWHRQGGRHKTIANFFFDDRFDEWIEKGLQLRESTRHRIQSATQRKEANDLTAVWNNMPEGDQKVLIDKSVAELKLRNPAFHLQLHHRRPMAYPMVRSKVRQLLQKQLAEQQKIPKTVSVEDALS